VSLEYCDSFDTYTTAQILRRYPNVPSGHSVMSIGTPGPSGLGQYIYSSGDYCAFLASITARSEYYLGFDYKNIISNGQRFLTIQTSAGATICSFLDAGSINTTFGNSAAGVINANIWQQIQIHLVISATVGVLVVKVDGVIVINLTGLNTGSTNIDQLNIGCEFSGNSSQPKYANLWVFNTLGSHSNTWPTGRMKVQASMPAADGTYTNWTPNSGSNHYSRVSEAQADDDTTYNSTVTTGNKDSYGIDAISGSPAHIHGVIVTAITRKTDVNSKNYQVFSKSGATETYSPDIAAALTYASSTQNGAASLLHTDDPNTGVEWTQANLNAIEVGAKVTL
jgi:hypothetical protein